MDSNIIKFTNIQEGKSSYSIELSMPFVGISVDESYHPLVSSTYKCQVTVLKGSSRLIPSETASSGSFSIAIDTQAVNGITSIIVDNENGSVSFSADVENVLSNGSIDIIVYLESSSNAVIKHISYNALPGYPGNDGLVYQYEFDAGHLYKFITGNSFAYTPKTLYIAAYQRQGSNQRERLTVDAYKLTATVLVNSYEVPIPVAWNADQQVFTISFEDNALLTVGDNTDYITQFNIRKLSINVISNDNVLLDRLMTDVNYGTSDDAARLVLNPTSIMSAIQNTKLVFDSDGLSTFRGGITMYNGTDTSSDQVLAVDPSGNLKVRGEIQTGSEMAGWAIKAHTIVSAGGNVGLGDGSAASPAGDFSFWAGNNMPEEAPFSVRKDGSVVASLLTIGGTQIRDGTIVTGKLQDGAVNHDALAVDAVDARNIRDGAIVTGHIYANSVTLDKLASDIGANLDISSNNTVSLLAGDLRNEIMHVQENAYGQHMTITFKNGNAFEYGKSIIDVTVHVWKDGIDVTDTLPPGSFRWQRESGDEAADHAWNMRADHRQVTTILLPRDEIGNSCVIRCIADEAWSYPKLSRTNDGYVYITVVDGGVNDNFKLNENIELLTTSDAYFINDHYELIVNTVSIYMEVESTVFDHSVLMTSHIAIKNDCIDIESGGDINLLAGADINVGAAANINIANNGHFTLSSGGNLQVENGGHVDIASGGNITIQSGGKLNVNAHDINLTATSTLYDEMAALGEDEIAILASAPESPVPNMLWLDISLTPAIFKRYVEVWDEEGNAVATWLVVNDDTEIQNLLSSLTERLATAESKITDTAITDTVMASEVYLTTVNALRAQMIAQSGTMDAIVQGLQGKADASEILHALEASQAQNLAIIQQLQSQITQLSDSVTIRIAQTTQVQNELAATQETLLLAQKTLDLYLRVTLEGVEIGRADDPAVLRADNASLNVRSVEAHAFTLLRNDQPSFRWTTGTTGSGWKYVG